MLPTRALLAACLLAPLPVVLQGTAHAAAYCSIPDTPALTAQESGPREGYLAGSGSDAFVDWVYPSPRPAAKEPTAAQRRDYAGFPNLTAIDVVRPDGTPGQKLIATWSTNVDAVMAQTSGMAVSDDGGLTFGPARSTPLREAPVQLHDGRLFGTAYYLSKVDAHTNELDVHTSTDLGQTWDTAKATFTSPDELVGGGVAHGVPIQLADGTVLVTVYARYTATGGKNQAELYASADGGRTFARRGVIARPAGEATYNETAIEQTADGSLLAVLRKDGGTYSTLAWSRSTDEGRTWSAVRDLQLSGQSCTVRGVAPRLLLMPNGVLVLSAGRPDDWLAISPDGRGDSWTQQRVTYHNRDGVYDTHGSSGYTALAAVGANRLVQLFDNCKLPGVKADGTLNETACPASGKFENGGWYAVKRRHLDVLAPGAGRIDLAAKQRAGELTVETNMTWADARRPRVRPDGAFDGSTAYWSSAVSQGPGEYVLHLDREQTFNRIGLSLRPGHPASASVYVSKDGADWGRPVATVTGRTDYALRHQPVNATGRHVKIVVEATPDCDAEIGPSCAMLNEVELSSTTDTFDNDPIWLRPRGYQSLSAAWVSPYEVGADRALTLSDKSTTLMAKAARTTTASARKTLEFRYKPVSVTNSFLFTVTSGTTSAYHLSISRAGAVSRYDAATKKWTTLAPAGTVGEGWTRIRLEATTSSATLYAGDRQIATLPRTAAVTSMDGYAFSSAGTAPTGDEALFDDVRFEDR
ncbi:exo-alpha-sialidase [Nonomuraea sp. NPDC001636]|uniref:exo-alpha-sialidase n=1 Tax=Nonomuraea sp. NPDC001636 TaxID=3154391 RepID=UPI003330D464